MRKKAWPKAISVLEEDDFCQHQYEQENHKVRRCLMGWMRHELGYEAEEAGATEGADPRIAEFTDAIFKAGEKLLKTKADKRRLQQEMRRVEKIRETPGGLWGDGHITALNDAVFVPKQTAAKVWNAAIYRLGYKTGNPKSGRT